MSDPQREPPRTSDPREAEWRAREGERSLSEVAKAAPPRPHRILVIEDDADAAESLGEVLQLEGHEVFMAHDGPRGVERARELTPDVVLCDVGLPGMDGYAVATVLRSDPGLRDTLLVALTGYARPEDQRRALDAGFDAHLTKPATLEALHEIIARAPRRSSSHGDGPRAAP